MYKHGKSNSASPPSNVGLSNAQHVDGGLVEFDEDTVKDLAQTQQLQNLAHFGAHTVDTVEEMHTDTALPILHLNPCVYRLTAVWFQETGLIAD